MDFFYLIFVLFFGFFRYIDEEQLVVNLKKFDTDLTWPDIMESWESLTSGISQLLKGTSIYIIGDSTEINEAVAKEIAIGIRYVYKICLALKKGLSKTLKNSLIYIQSAPNLMSHGSTCATYLELIYIT